MLLKYAYKQVELLLTIQVSQRRQPASLTSQRSQQRLLGDPQAVMQAAGMLSRLTPCPLPA